MEAAQYTKEEFERLARGQELAQEEQQRQQSRETSVSQDQRRREDEALKTFQ